MGLIAGALGFAVGAGLTYYFRNDIERVFKKNTSGSTTDSGKKVVVQTTPKSTPDAESAFNIDQAKREMEQYATVFYGCFNGINSVAQGTTKYRETIIRDWNQRMADEKKFPMLHRYWERLFGSRKTMTDQQYEQAAQEFIQFLELCDIHHDEIDSQIRIEENTRMYYGAWEDDEGKWQIGNEKKVKTPAWYIKDTVLEKGFLY